MNFGPGSTRPGPFAGEVTWVTGASSGIGRALALAFAHAGANVILSARDRAALEQVRAECPDPQAVAILPFDLARLDDLPMVASLALRAWGRVNCLVHNAGVALRGRLWETPLELDQRIMATNYFGPLAITKAILPSMLARRSGRIVVISSLSGKYGVPQLSAYAAAKHALHGGFDSLRAEVHAQGVQVTIIVPGVIRTAILEHALTPSGAFYGRSKPEYQRGMAPEECARRILRAVAAGKQEVVIGGLERLTVPFYRFFPRAFAAFIRSHPVRWGERFWALLPGVHRHHDTPAPPA